MKRVIVAGGSGAVGRALLPVLAASGVAVWAWGRRRVDIQGVTDLSGPLDGLPPVDTAFCSLGTTHAQAGSDAAFRAVDFDLVLAFAQAAQRAGAQTFVVVSSQGAKSNSWVHYSRVKGEIEAALAGLGFGSLIVVRPSLLLDERPGRKAENIAVQFARTLAPMLTWLPMRGIEVRTLARAMVRLAEDAAPGVRVVENQELHGIGGGNPGG